MQTLQQLGQRAKEASRQVAILSTAEKNAALEIIAQQLLLHSAEIIQQNKQDIENAMNNGMSKAMTDRLLLDEARIQGIAQGVRDVAALQDPVGKVESGFTTPSGLQITKVRVPMGVIGIIYEARPNVTADAAALCLKAGNAVILRGGKEAICSNKAIVKVMQGALEQAGLTQDAIILVEDTSRDSATAMMKLNGLIDVLIPRGGAGLIQAVVQNATVPVIETGTGNCHIYVDKDADLDMAVNIIFNAKTSRPSVCNACESVLVHRAVAEKFLPLMKQKLDEKAVKILGCEESAKYITIDGAATEQDYATEFLDYILSVKVVDNIEQAVKHITRFGTGHSECIITGSYQNAQYFTQRVDAAAVYVNASTRFTDGGEFGFGAEIGISTQKLHARGPMGLPELTTNKYIVQGSGQIR